MAAQKLTERIERMYPLLEESRRQALITVLTGVVDISHHVYVPGKWFRGTEQIDIPQFMASALTTDAPTLASMVHGLAKLLTGESVKPAIVNGASDRIQILGFVNANYRTPRQRLAVLEYIAALRTFTVTAPVRVEYQNRQIQRELSTP